MSCVCVREIEERDKGFNLKKNKQNDLNKKFNLKFSFSLFFLFVTGGRIRAVLGDDLILPAILSFRTKKPNFLSRYFSLMICKFKLG